MEVINRVAHHPLTTKSPLILIPLCLSLAPFNPKGRRIRGNVGRFDDWMKSSLKEKAFGNNTKRRTMVIMTSILVDAPTQP